MSSNEAEELFNRADNASGLSDIALQGVGGTILALFQAMIMNVVALGELVANPVGAFTNGIVEFVNTLFVDVVSGILGAGASETIRSLQGQWGVGPFTILFAVAMILGSLWLVSAYRDEEATGNLIPGLPTDIPFIGQDEEAED